MKKRQRSKIRQRIKGRIKGLVTLLLAAAMMVSMIPATEIRADTGVNYYFVCADGASLLAWGNASDTDKLFQGRMYYQNPPFNDYLTGTVQSYNIKSFTIREEKADEI